MRLKIAMVCPYDYTLPGGVQSHVHDLARAMGVRGHRVRIIAPQACGALARDPDTCLFVGSRRRIRFSGSQIDVVLAWGRELSRLRRFLADEAFDVVHYHTMWNPFLPLQVRACARGSASVATFHDAAPDSLFGRLAGAVLMPLAGALIGRFMVDATIAVSAVPAAYLGAFLAPARMAVIPNGVDVPAFSRSRYPRLPRYADGRLNLLFLGRLEDRKGVFDLLEAYARLERRHPNLRLIVAGDGYQEASLRQRATALGVRCMDVVGLVAEADKASTFASADIFCSPARYGESFGIVLLEAMAAGCAIVAAANPGYAQVMRGEGQRGLVPARDVDALESRLSEFIEHPALRASQVAWGLAEVQHYDWPRVAEGVEEVYLRALAARASRGSATVPGGGPR